MCGLYFAVQMVAAFPVHAQVETVPLSIQRESEVIGRFHVEIADTPQERAQGLMDRRFLPSNGGMLFVFPRVQPGVAMWMKNTLIPLDMLFFDAQGTLRHIIAEAQPCPPEGDCPSLPAPDPVAYVLEIAGGRAAELGIELGDRFVIAESAD